MCCPLFHRYGEALRQNLPDRTTKVTAELLPFLKRVEMGVEPLSAAGPRAVRQRNILFAWCATVPTSVMHLDVRRAQAGDFDD